MAGAPEGPKPCGDFPARPALSDFQLGAPLGRGALCGVRAATHAPTGRAYALKAFSKAALRRASQRAPATPHLVLQEQLVGAALGAALGVRLHCTFQDAACIYFVYDLARGGELWAAACMAGGQPACLEAGQVAALGTALVRALAALHGAGVAHRDLKPENLVLLHGSGGSGGSGGGDGGGGALLAPLALGVIDWGTAKVFAPQAAGLPQAHNFPHECVGTLEYMAPEALDNGGAGGGVPTDARADLWSLACTLARCLCGVTPFAAPSPYLASQRALAHEAAGPSATASGWDGLLFPPGTPRDAEDLLRALLRRQPSQRLGAQGAAPNACLTLEAVLAHPWLAAAAAAPAPAPAPAGSTPSPLQQPPATVHVPSLRHLALGASARVIVRSPSVPLAVLRRVMGAGAGLPNGHAAAAAVGEAGLFQHPWARQWQGVRRLTPLARLELLHRIVLARRAALPHVMALFCESLGQARCARALAVQEVQAGRSEGGGGAGAGAEVEVVPRQLG
jgi:serine/threonine protein kinase